LARFTFRISASDGLRYALGALPVTGHILRLLKIPIFKHKEAVFFYKIIQRTLEHRQVTNTKRNDLIDMMLDALKDNLAEDADRDEQDQFDLDSKLAGTKQSTGDKSEVDEMIILSTALVFLVVG